MINHYSLQCLFPFDVGGTDFPNSVQQLFWKLDFLCSSCQMINNAMAFNAYTIVSGALLCFDFTIVSVILWLFRGKNIFRAFLCVLVRAFEKPGMYLSPSVFVVKLSSLISEIWMYFVRYY